MVRSTQKNDAYVRLVTAEFRATLSSHCMPWRLKRYYGTGGLHFITWSSYRSYACGEDGLVRINDWRWWEKKIRDKAGVKGS